MKFQTYYLVSIHIMEGLVTVIAPNKNGGAFLQQFLDSLLSQTYSCWNAIIVDDGSNDDSINILEEFSLIDRRIKYIRRSSEPAGAPSCRNIGLQSANNSEYIIFVDTDDILDSNCLQQRVQFMKKHEELDFSIFPAITFHKVPYDLDNAYVYGCKFLDDSLKAMLNWTLPMVGWTNVYKYSSFAKYNIMWDVNLKSMQDSDFNIQNILKGCKFAYANEYDPTVMPDYFYRIDKNGKSISTKIKTKAHFESNYYLLSKILKSLSKEQKKKYSIDLQCYIFMFLQFMASDYYYFRKVLSLPWIRHKYIFCLKVRLFFKRGQTEKDKKNFFPTLVKHKEGIDSKWHDFMKNQYQSFKSNYLQINEE